MDGTLDIAGAPDLAQPPDWPSDRAVAWNDFALAMQGEVRLLRDRCLYRYRRELPPCSSSQLAQARPAWIEMSLREFTDALLDNRLEVSADRLEAFFLIGSECARYGITLADLLRALRISVEVLRGRGYEIGPDGPDREACLLRLFELADAWMDVAMIEMTRGHDDAVAAARRRLRGRADELVERVLSGSATLVDLHDQFAACRLDPQGEYRVVCVRPDGEAEAAEVEELLLGASEFGSQVGALARIDGDIRGFVNRLPSADAPYTIGISKPAGVADLPSLVRQALRAMETAHLTGRSGIFELADLGLDPTILYDSDVGEASHRRFIQPVLGSGDGGPAILATVERYIAHNRGVKAACAELYVHANTIRYRLGRFEELTQCSLKDIQTLFEAWWALRRYLFGADTPPLVHQ